MPFMACLVGDGLSRIARRTFGGSQIHGFVDPWIHWTHQFMDSEILALEPSPVTDKAMIGFRGSSCLTC